MRNPHIKPCDTDDIERNEAIANGRLMAAAPELFEALKTLVNTRALSGVRELAAGWNGENRPEGRYENRHPSRLGARIETNCGGIYELDELMIAARSAIAKAEGRTS